jgi:NAD(P) transhydrogenase subunit beta
MTILSPTWTAILYLAAAVCFILALKGLSSPKTARRGNLIGATGALVGVVTVFLSMRLENIPWILAAIAVGSAIAAPVARRVQMTQMPQLVAMFNGVGGGAAALVALLELGHATEVVGAGDTNGLYDLTTVVDPWVGLAIAFTLLVGSVSFAGSMVTFAKLQELMTTRPVVFTGLPVIMGAVLLAAIAAAVAVILTGAIWIAVVLIAIGLVAGVLLVLPVGGADVPIVISLLNASTGLAVAASGLVLGNVLLVVAGTLVGASGTILTRAMASAMGRSVTGILFGAFRGGSTAGSTAVSDRPVRSSSAEDVAVLLGYAQKVLIVPGYGLAVAQGQHTVAELQSALEARGIEVVFAIHPVAGRMPGHMNVLLAEANVPYESLKEMSEVNPEFKTADVALVVGANDVVNPAAKTTPGSPIYGMPILEVEDARQVVFLKRSMRPGFAGIENELLFEPQTTLLFGDAKDSLTKVLTAVKAL